MSDLVLDTPHGPVRLEMRDPVNLGLADKNVMHHSDAEMQRLTGSVGAHGFLEVPLYNETTGHIVAGAARREAAIANHLDAIPVFVGQWDAKTEKAISIALQGKQYGSWNDEALTAALEDLRAGDFDLDLTGLEPFRLDDLLGSPSAEETAYTPFTGGYAETDEETAARAAKGPGEMTGINVLMVIPYEVYPQYLADLEAAKHRLKITGTIEITLEALKRAAGRA